MKKRLKKGRASGKEKWLFFLLGLCLMTMALPDTVRAQTNALPNAEEITAGKEETLTVSGSTVSGPVVPAQYMARATARDVVEYQIEVGGVPVTSQNAGNVLEGTDNDGKVSYDPDTGILTLNGADISCNSRGKGSLRSERNDLTVQLLNQNRMEDTSTSAGGVTPSISYVFSSGNLTFCGEGSLEITGQPTITQANGCNLYGIRCEGNFKQQSGTVTVTVGDYTGNSRNHYTNQAVCVSGEIHITGGKLTAKSGRSSKVAQSAAIMTTKKIEISDAEVIAESGEGLTSFGIYTNEGLDIRNSSVAFTSGKGAGNGASIAVACQTGSKLTINNSDIVAVSGEAGGDSQAIRSGELELNDSSMTAKGGTSTDGGSWGLSIDTIVLHGGEITAESGNVQTGNSTGIWSEKLELNNNSSVTAKGGTSAGNSSYGLSVDNIILHDSAVIAKSDAGTYSLGTWCSELEINNGNMTVKGGDAASESYGLSAASFKLNGGNVRAEAGTAADWSIGLWTNSAEIFDGVLVAIAGQADGINAVTSAPDFLNNYKAIVKAGNGEADADIIEFPTEETYWGNAYISIEPYYHMHAWSAAWTFNDTHHWHTCAGEDCGVTDIAKMDAYGLHAYDNGEDTDCNVCGAKRTVPSKPDAPSYQIIDGANGKWKMEEEGSLKIKGNGDFVKFQGVKVDGSRLGEENYDVQPGSTIVILKAAYLKTLAEGSHSFEMLWTDGTAETVFTIVANIGSSGSGGTEGGNGGTEGGSGGTGSGSGGTEGGNGGTEGGSGGTEGGNGGNNGGNSSNVSGSSSSIVNTGNVPVNNVPAESGDKKDDVPKTGDETSNIWLLSALAASGAGIVLTGKRRKFIK